MLNAQTREPKRKLGEYRNQGKVPAIIYGHGFDCTPILIDEKEFIKIIRVQGESNLIDLQIGENKPFKVIIQDYEKDLIKEKFMHIDLLRIHMDEKLKTEIGIKFVGQAPAVKDGYILVKNKDWIRVECLPGDLITEFEIDISKLENVRDAITIGDITPPEGITIVDDPGVNIVTVSEMKEEEEAVSKEDEAAVIEELGKAPEKQEESGESADQTKEKAK